MKFNNLAYNSPGEMIFGSCPKPVSCKNGMIIGGGIVYPEVKFTLPIMELSLRNEDEIRFLYKQIVSEVLNRVSILKMEGVVLEFEHLPFMTENPEYGAAITRTIREAMSVFSEQHSTPCLLRVTPVDIRSEKIRTGERTKILFKSFERNCEAGADLVAIESIGGKSVHDKAIVEGDIAGILLSLGILGCKDMEFLWDKIVTVSNKYSCIPSGDSACGFANTAMVLADRSYIPKVLATIVRAMSAARTLVAVESGARGPSKDCAYEGPIVKAISGTPISMEGKSSACAHFSHLGNVAAALCDLWSNESVQQVKLLAGYAPECFSEILSYDCRLMNTAVRTGNAKLLQSLFVESDIAHNPQAFIIAPEIAFKIAESIVSESSNFGRTFKAAITACTLLRDGFQKNVFKLEKPEIIWLDKIEGALDSLDTEEKVFTATQQYKNLYDSGEYGV